MAEHFSGVSGKTRVAVYARFSCDKQRDASIEDQIYEAERYCERHDYEIVKVYADYAISGRSDDRPQFLAMIDDAQNGAFDVVLVWKMDRFARNMQDQFYHEKILADSGVRLESVKENIAGNGIEASMSKGMHAIFAQIRSQQSAEDTMRGMIGKARKCQYLGYQWLGYSHDGDVITLDPATAPIAREVHTRYIQGDSMKSIVEWLNSIGVRGRNGQAVKYQYVTGILKNWVYAGVYTWGKLKDEQGRVMRDTDGNAIPLVRIEDGVPAIVTTAEKERCIMRLNYRKHVNGKAAFVLSGKLYCPECGYPMHGNTCTDRHKIKHFQYICKGKRKACNGVYWQEKLESTIARAVRGVFSDAETADHIADRFVKWRSGKKPTASIDAAISDLKSIEKQRDNLIKAVEDGMPYKHVKEKIEKLDEQQEGIERKIKELEHSKKELTKADILLVLAALAEGAESDEDVLKKAVSQVWVFGDYAMAIMNFCGKNSTKFEVMTAYENSRNSRSSTVSAEIELVPPNRDKTIQSSPISYTTEGVPVILLESGIGILVSLKAA